VLGRARRRTVVIDSGEQSNRASPVIGGLLGYDQRPPAELYAAGRRELSSYASVEYRFGHVRRGSCGDGRFELEVDDGRPIHARRVLLTTGMQYCPPDIPGLAELWGTSVFQCPFCHGWEMRDKRLAALAAGDEAVHAALMLRGWSDDVVLLTDGRSDLSPADVNALRSADVVIDDRRIVEIIDRDGELTEIAFADGTGWHATDCSSRLRCDNAHRLPGSWAPHARPEHLRRTLSASTRSTAPTRAACSRREMSAPMRRGSVDWTNGAPAARDRFTGASTDGSRRCITAVVPYSRILTSEAIEWRGPT
jgi:thioredoxin reductase